MLSALTFALRIAPVTAQGAINLLIDLLIFVILAAAFIILVRWLLQLMGVAIPQPIMIVLGLIVVLILLLFALRWLGLWA